MLLNLSTIISDGRLQMSGLPFKQIASIARSHFSHEQVRQYSRKTDSKVQLLFPDRELILSQSEMQCYNQTDPAALRLLAGAAESQQS